MSRDAGRSRRAVGATLLSTCFAGLAPILGKLAYQAGVDPTTLVALRTALAAGLLWLFYAVFWRRYITIDWHKPGWLRGHGPGQRHWLAALLQRAGPRGRLAGPPAVSRCTRFGCSSFCRRRAIRSRGWQWCAWGWRW